MSRGREDLYRILGVPVDADQAAIRRAYQKLVRRYHPDLHPGDREARRRFRTISLAYRVLVEPERGGRPRTGSSLRLSARWTEAAASDTLIDWQTLLGAGHREAGIRGTDLVVELTVDFGEAVRGVVTSFSVQREKVCPGCRGAGEAGGEACASCAGRGVLVELERLRIRVPPGVADGSRVRLPGRGNPSPVGGDHGDLYLTLKIRPHPYFERRGNDIHADLPITLAEAVLGAEVEVPTIDGPVRVKIPPGTSGGQRFRLRERGVLDPTGRRGDHFYTVRVVVPERLDEASREILARLEQEDPRRELPKDPV